MRCHLICLLSLAALGLAQDAPSGEEDPPEGYYAFVESPNATPPRVRPPPYRISGTCSGRGRVSADNLCGDLNRGDIPANPIHPRGEPYPFEIIRNATLRFLSRALPVLRHDATLPRVTNVRTGTGTGGAGTGGAGTGATGTGADYQLLAREMEDADTDDTDRPVRTKRAVETSRPDSKFCAGGGVLCMLYRAIGGEAGAERREDPAPPSPPRYEGPPTPCPARVEYATPVFARNYQALWRYVVQIPYEGYFTQTIEVTRCMQSRCHYLDGGCLSSPRWLSLLVAELHYPQSAQSAQSPTETSSQSPISPQSPNAANFASQYSPAQPVDPQQFQEYQQFNKRAGTVADTDKHCDGHDEQGCFQVRLYYDWFLVPGSCKCWRPDYFARYVRRHSQEL